MISNAQILASLAADLSWALSLGSSKEMANIEVPIIIGSLAAAVIRMVHADATKVRASRPGGWPLSLKVRKDALRFAFSPEEDYLAMRMFWCQQANIHPDKLRAVIVRDIRKLLAGGRRVSRTGAVRSPLRRDRDNFRVESGS